MKMGGIQHIICSATMTINKLGRVTPRMSKVMAKKKQSLDDVESTLEALCKLLKFRSRKPKVIDLTENVEEGNMMMPGTLTEMMTKVKTEEKDLYLYYYL